MKSFIINWGFQCLIKYQCLCTTFTIVCFNINKVLYRHTHLTGNNFQSFLTAFNCIHNFYVFFFVLFGVYFPTLFFLILLNHFSRQIAMNKIYIITQTLQIHLIENYLLSISFIQNNSNMKNGKSSIENVFSFFHLLLFFVQLVVVVVWWIIHWSVI